jgi:hypothetical protein
VCASERGNKKNLKYISSAMKVFLTLALALIMKNNREKKQIDKRRMFLTAMKKKSSQAAARREGGGWLNFNYNYKGISRTAQGKTKLFNFPPFSEFTPSEN